MQTYLVKQFSLPKCYTVKPDISRAGAAFVPVVEAGSRQVAESCYVLIAKMRAKGGDPIHI